jgi:hypothetical protein
MLRAALIMVVSGSSIAHAQPAEIEPGSASYAPFVVGTDGIALGLLAGAYATNESRVEPVFETAAVWTFRLGAPIVHLIEGRPMRAAGSLALRLVLPFVGGYLDGQLEGHSGFGAGLGAIAAAVLDAALAGHDDRPIARGVLPTLTADRERIGVGLVGRF